MSVSLTIALGPPESLTTGASPTPADANVQFYEITSGGTAGDEIIEIPAPDLDGNGFNAQLVGRRMILTLKTQTDPGDVIKFFSAGSNEFPTYLPPTLTGSSHIAAALDFEGATIALIWTGKWWVIDDSLTNYNFSGPYTAADVFYFLSGNHFILQGLPTSDPAVTGALWNSAGTLKVSAG